MYVKITNIMSGNIARRAFNKKRALYLQEKQPKEDALVVRCYEHVYKKEEREWLAACPNKNWIALDKCFWFNVDGWNVKLEHSVGLLAFNRGCTNRGSIKDQELSKEIQAFVKERDELLAKFKTQESDLQRMIVSCGSIKKLKEFWPEGIEFYEKYEAPAKSKEISLPFSDFNKVLGLEEAK